jgi:hypothetical protein
MRGARKNGDSQHPRKAHSPKRKGAEINKQAAAVVEITPQKALAEAIRHLGPDATPSALVQFAKERFGSDLQFFIVCPKSHARLTGPHDCKAKLVDCILLQAL